MNIYIWLGICFCITQSAIFSGLNLAFFSISKLRLKIESTKGNLDASKILELRDDSNFLLTTILWGNVGINVLLALLSKSVLAGVAAFLFSTVLITILGEIIPQALFSRHAVKIGATLSPVIRLYQLLLYPVAKPTAMVLDAWLGAEAIPFFQENDLRQLIKVHVASDRTDIDKVEGIGVLNFLALDDIPVTEEGEVIDPESIITLDFVGNLPLFPDIGRALDDPFLQQIQAPNKKWIIITDFNENPMAVLDSDSFLRSALFDISEFNPYAHCHRPIIIKDKTTPLGEVIMQLKVFPTRTGDDVIDEDIILFWNDEEKRVITGADILGRLLRGISKKQSPRGEYSFFRTVKDPK